MKYALHSGWVSSAADGDWHYIGYGQLLRLYGLRKRDCIHWAVGLWNPNDFVHLYSRWDGKYRETMEAATMTGPLEAQNAALQHALHQYQFAAAEFAGTNSAVDIERQAALFRKHREVFQDLQYLYHDVIKITEKSS